MIALRAVLLGLAALAVATAAGEAAPGAAPPAATTAPPRSDPRLLGDPAGLRTQLERAGVSVQLFSNHFGSWRMAGGVSRDDRFGHSGTYDLLALVDAEELVGLRGASSLLHVKGGLDRSLNADVGALSDPIDDADFDEAIYVAQLWVQQAFLRGRARLRVGFLEQQTVFDRNAFANNEDRQFMATFLDNGLVPLPNGLGAVLFAAPTEWLELAAGVADGDNVPRRSGYSTAFDGVRSLTAHLEATARLRVPGRDLPGTFRAGVFRDGRERAVFAGDTAAAAQPGLETKRGHWGAYLSVDQRVWRSGAGRDAGLGLFGRFGVADPDTIRFAWFWSAGLSADGPLPGRDGDVLGLGAYQVLASAPYRRNANPDADRETGIELYYAMPVLPWLVLTPDVQAILDPGGAGAGRTAWLATLRARITY